jgi:hypothetical protein
MQHSIYIAWLICIWSFVVTYDPTVPVQLSIVRCPRRGTMRLHTLRGMKEKDICIAFIWIHLSDICRWCVLYPQRYLHRGPTHCIHVHTLSDICRYCWHRKVLYNLSWLFEEMRWYWLYWDYWVLYLQVFLILFVILLECWLIQFVV